MLCINEGRKEQTLTSGVQVEERKAAHHCELNDKNSDKGRRIERVTHQHHCKNLLQALHGELSERNQARLRSAEGGLGDDT